VRLMNSAVAVAAGFIANMLSEWIGLGSPSPFVFAIPFLMIVCYIISRTWNENKGTSNSTLQTNCVSGLRSIITNKNILLVGWTQSMFESVMFVFVFLWTPVLQPAGPPLGIVFSSFMCCTWIGGSCWELYLKSKFQDTITVSWVLYSVMVLNGLAAVASANHPRTSFLIFLLIQFMCGIYFPTMGRLRAKLLPKVQHSAIMNWFRVPLNAVASYLLIDLHDSHSSHGITHIFTLCAGLLLCGGCSAVLLHQSCKTDSINRSDMPGQMHSVPLQSVTVGDEDSDIEIVT